MKRSEMIEKLGNWLHTNLPIADYHKTEYANEILTFLEKQGMVPTDHPDVRMKFDPVAGELRKTLNTEWESEQDYGEVHTEEM